MMIRRSTKGALVSSMGAFVIWNFFALIISAADDVEFWFGWTTGTKLANCLILVPLCIGVYMLDKRLNYPNPASAI